MSLSPEELRFIAEYTASVIGKINQVLANRITTTFTNSNDVIPSSKLVKDEFAAVRSEIPTNTSDLTNDGADGTHAFIVEGDSRLDDTRNPKAHNQASLTITDTNTYSNIGNTSQNQASINSAINEKIGALMNLDIIEQVSTRPTASADTLNKIYLVPEETENLEDAFKAYITVYTDNSYNWERIDIARIDLSDYVKKNNIDTTLIQSSANPVSGGAVYTAIENAKTSINNNLAAVATSGSYNDLTNKPSIPTKTSDLTNDNEFITEDNIDDALDEFLKQSAFVSSNKPIIQSGESSILTARMFGIPSTQNIEFYEKKTNGSSILLDTIPLNNGVATYNYIGSGAGSKQFYVKSGSILSETFEVTDCMWYDKGTDTDHNTWVDDYNRATFTRDANGTRVTNTASNYTYIIANKSGTTSADYDWDTPLKIEFDITHNISANYPTIQIYDANNHYFQELMSFDGHNEITVNSDNVVWTVNGETKKIKETSIGKSFVRLRIEVGSDFTFHDFKIYPI